MEIHLKIQFLKTGFFMFTVEKKSANQERMSSPNHLSISQHLNIIVLLLEETIAFG